MKKFLALFLAMVCFCASGITPYYMSVLHPDGTPDTNAVYITMWPPGQPFYIYGTNTIYGPLTLTNVPNSSGFYSNNIEPASYTVRIADMPQVGFFVTVPDTSTYTNLALYSTNVPYTAANNGLFGLVTNWLGYWPATNNYSGITGALGYQAATNGGLVSYTQLPWTPPTNTPAGVVYALNFQPATNGYAGLTLGLGFDPATNTPSGIISALGYTPATNVTSLTYTEFTNGASGALTAFNTYYTNTFNRKINVYFQASVPSGALVTMNLYQSNNAYASPQFSTAITNVLECHLSPGDYVVLSNTVGSATIVTNFVQY